jgi:uncharacterized protein (TIGR02996 family)
MTDATALLAAIRAAADDDAPRLVYADWLDEHGQPERAEFVRVQCELARRKSPALRRRAAELLAARHDAFAGPLAAPGLRFRFERGFIAGFGHTGLFASANGSEFYRFFCDGSWQGVSGPLSIEDACDSLRRARLERRQYDSSRYRIDTACIPLRIWLGLEATPSASLLPSPMHGSPPILEIVNRFVAKSPRRRFTHVHLPGFDSFPET